MAKLQEGEVISLISLGSSVILLLIVGIAIFLITYQRRMIKAHRREQQMEQEHQRSMIQLEFESQEAERKRIAADLHDSVGSLLWAAKLTASFIERTIETNEKSRMLHEELRTILDQSITTVKQISWELTPEAFQYSGLSASVESLCRRLDGKNMQVIFEETEAHVWKGKRALVVYRIIQELVSNSIKHSEAEWLRVAFAWSPSQLMVDVIDNGIGFSVEEKRNGVGWWNIQHRADSIHALIQLGEIPTGRGAHVTLHIPLDDEK
jgi:signal transduction histidine kinase